MKNKPPKVKKQHFVPRCYLKNFCIDKTNIHVLDKKELKEFKSNIINIANQSYFYDLQNDKTQLFENFFCEIENDFNKILIPMFERLEKLNTSFYEFSEEEKDYLSTYFCLQWVRTPHIRGIASSFFKSILEKISKMLNLKNNKIIVHEDKTMPLHSLFILKMIERRIDEYIKNQSWFLIINKTQRPFYTSDNPAILDSEFCQKDGRGKGFLSNGMNFYLPLSSKYCLFIVENKLLDNCSRSNIKNNVIYTNNEEHIIYVNELQIFNATRQIYASSNLYFNSDIEYLKNKLSKR